VQECFIHNPIIENLLSFGFFVLFSNVTQVMEKRPTVVRGNASEIMALASVCKLVVSEGTQSGGGKGVDRCLSLSLSLCLSLSLSLSLSVCIRETTEAARILIGLSLSLSLSLSVSLSVCVHRTVDVARVWACVCVCV